MNRTALLQLSAQADQLLQFDMMSTLKRLGPGIGKSALKWGGIGAAGGAAVGGISGAMSDDPDRGLVGGAFKGALEGGALGAAGGAGMRSWKYKNAISRLGRMNAGRGMREASMLSSKTDRLVQLSDKLDEVLAFEDLTGKPNRKGQRPEDNMRRGLGMGFLSPLSPVPFGGMLAGGLEANAYTKAGAVLRKRDVAGHEAVGFLGGVGGAVGGGLLGGLAGPRGQKAGALIGGLGGYSASRYGISKHTLNKRKEELKHGIQI